MRRTYAFALTVPLALALLASTAAAKEYRFTHNESFEVDRRVRLSLTALSGDITIFGADTDVITIEAEKIVDAVGMDQAAVIADHIKIKTSQSRNKIDLATMYLTIADHDPGFWDKLLGMGSQIAAGRVNFLITVPERTDLAITGGTGVIRVRNVTGAVTINGSDAAISLNTVEGAVVINNGAGATYGELLFGPIEVRQPLGEIVLKWVEGDIRVKSLSASIDIEQEAGSLDIVTRTGAVTIRTNLESNRDYFVETQSGNINFFVPVTASGLLHISSEMGEIQTDVPVSIEKYSREGLIGRFGIGGVKVKLVSGSGDVTVAEF